MKINPLEGTKGGLVGEVRGSKTPSVENRPSGSVRGSSEIEISEKARLMKTAFDTAKMAPDVRADRVNMLKSKIKDGSYKIDAEAVAERLIGEHLDTDFGKNNL